MSCLMEQLRGVNAEVAELKEVVSTQVADASTNNVVLLEAQADLYERQVALEESQLEIMGAIADLYEMVAEMVVGDAEEENKTDE